MTSKLDQAQWTVDDVAIHARLLARAIEAAQRLVNEPYLNDPEQARDTADAALEAVMAYAEKLGRRLEHLSDQMRTADGRDAPPGAGGAACGLNPPLRAS